MNWLKLFYTCVKWIQLSDWREETKINLFRVTFYCVLWPPVFRENHINRWQFVVPVRSLLDIIIRTDLGCLVKIIGMPVRNVIEWYLTACIPPKILCQYLRKISSKSPPLDVCWNNQDQFSMLDWCILSDIWGSKVRKVHLVHFTASFLC